jgi:hypothetical protein
MFNPCSLSSSSVRRARLKGVTGMTDSVDRCWPTKTVVNSGGFIKQLTDVTGPLCCENLRSACRLGTSKAQRMNNIAGFTKISLKFFGWLPCITTYVCPLKTLVLVDESSPTLSTLPIPPKLSTLVAA